MKTKLIDAYSLLEVIRESGEKNPHCDSKIRANHTIEHDHIAHKVLEQPAAYDVDKVVEKIREYADNVAELGGNFLPQVVIEIVKSGGANGH